MWAYRHGKWKPRQRVETATQQRAFIVISGLHSVVMVPLQACDWAYWEFSCFK